MAASSQTALQELMKLYFEGQSIEAIERVAQQPDFSYTDLEGDSLLGRRFFSYLDAQLFGNLDDCLQTNNALKKIMGDQAVGNLEWEQFLHILHFARPDELPGLRQGMEKNPTRDLLLFTLLELKEGADLTESKVQQLTKQYPTLSEQSIHAILAGHNTRKHFLSAKNSWWDSLGEERSLAPVFPVSYPEPDSLQQTFVDALGPADGTPALFIQPHRMDWDPILSLLGDRDVVFLFPNLNRLWSCLQIPALAQRLETDNSILLVYNLPVLPQLKVQHKIDSDSLQMITPQYDQALFDLICGCVREDTTAADRLQRLGQEVTRQEAFHRLGSHRSLAFCTRDQYAQHRAFAPPIYGPTEEIDLFAKTLSRFDNGTPRRPVRSEGKLRIAHVVPLLIDKEHQPTERTRELLKNYGPDATHAFLFVTEAHRAREMEYPTAGSHSRCSYEKGGQTIAELRKANVFLEVENGKEPLEISVKSVIEKLHAAEIDIAVFPDSDIFSLAVARGCDVPHRVYLQFGTPPRYRGFDQWIASEPPTSAETAFCLAAGTEISCIDGNLYDELEEVMSASALGATHAPASQE
jgi:hypothetical protein